MPGWTPFCRGLAEQEIWPLLMVERSGAERVERVERVGGCLWLGKMERQEQRHARDSELSWEVRNVPVEPKF